MKYWKFTHIDHAFRRAAQIDLNEYAVLDVVYKEQTHPGSNVNGWTKISQQEIADALGIGKSTVGDILRRMERIGLLATNPDSPRWKQTTEKWWRHAYTDQLTDDAKKVVEDVKKMTAKRFDRNPVDRIPVKNRPDSGQNRPDSGQQYNKQTTINNIPIKDSKKNDQSGIPPQEIRIRKKIKEAAGFFNDYPAMIEQMTAAARIRPGNENFDFFEELEKWVRHKSSSPHVMANLRDHIVSGAGSFQSWLMNEITQNKIRKTNAKRKNGNSTKSGKIFEATDAQHIVKSILNEFGGAK